ncbi:MAG: hypothetical protein JRN52_02195 [Nitrososphaerota archaeon]|nr:hypothetical protein [Nitrososphaerota archaeon]
MHWIECNKHPGIYFDSSVHKRCPDCGNEILKSGLIKSLRLAIDEHNYGGAILDWSILVLECLETSGSSKEEIKAKKDSAKDKVNDIRNQVVEDLDALTKFVEENDLSGIFR